METSPITARSLEKYYYIDGDEFERAYKEHLSGFRSWNQLDHADRWLIFPENMGEHLSIDETSLSDGELYTILTNKERHGRKGALVAIIQGTQIDNTIKVLNQLPFKDRCRVKEVTMDFCEGMNTVVKTCFIRARRTIDRFHMQRLCCDALQELRLKLKREAHKKEVEAREQFKHKRKRKNASKKIRKNKRFEPERLANGDTLCELLSRSHYLLQTSYDKWSASQQERARILFDIYPELRKGYNLTHYLRMIFNNKRHTIESGRLALKDWYASVAEFDNDAFNTVAATIYEREKDILNYFIRRATNASAESFNSKIKSFRAQLRGVVDVKFFLFRVSKIWG